MSRTVIAKSRVEAEFEITLKEESSIAAITLKSYVFGEFKFKVKVKDSAPVGDCGFPTAHMAELAYSVPLRLKHESGEEVSVPVANTFVSLSQMPVPRYEPLPIEYVTPNETVTSPTNVFEGLWKFVIEVDCALTLGTAFAEKAIARTSNHDKILSRDKAFAKGLVIYPLASRKHL